MNRNGALSMYAILTLACLGATVWFAIVAWDKFDLRAMMRGEAVEVTAVVVESGYYVVETGTPGKAGGRYNERRHGTVLLYPLHSGETVKRTFEIPESDLHRFPAGAEVPVRYLPDAPDQAEIFADSLGAGRWFDILLAAIFGSVAPFLLGFLPEVLRSRPKTG